MCTLYIVHKAYLFTHFIYIIIIIIYQSITDYSSTKNKWDYKGLEIIVSHWSLPNSNAAREILIF